MSVFRALRSVFAQNSAAEEAAPKRAFLARLARNEAGNMMAIMAISLLPLAGLVGGALDMSRLYIVKTRLQQACDAGALAGRRIMAAGQWNANGGAANTAALQFFDGNFENDSFGTSNRTRAFTEAGGRVTGTASVQVPMTLMRIFGQSSRTVSVSCDAEMRLPNTDVMFVLDTTGSMNETIPGDTDRKMDTLQFAVKCFYETVAKLNVADVDCTPGSPGPTGGTGNQVQIRFGFVPYATNVNVGKLLPAEYFADEWSYQSRVANYTTPTYVDTVIGSETVTWETYGQSIDRDDCGRWGNNQQFTNEAPGGTVYTPNPSGNPTYTGTNPIVRRTYKNNKWQDWGYSGATDTSGTYQTCRREVTRVNVERVLRYGFTNWTYRPESIDVNAYVADRSALFATGATGTVATPGSYDMRELATMSGTEGITTATLNWDGCIEERQTVRATNFAPIPNDALDLNLNLVPSSSSPAGFTNGVPRGSYWGPALPGAVFTRGATNNNRGQDYNRAEIETTTIYANPNYQCPTEARKLQSWTASAIQSYVNSLTPSGNTYHDIGLLWGARLMSPTGIFAGENDFTPQGGEIERHIIFMTDGQTCTDVRNYAAYGLPWYDRRQIDANIAPTPNNSNSCSSNSNAGSTLTQQTDLRFPALCSAIKNHVSQPTLWVVYFGSTDVTTRTRMQNCATPGRFFYATNSATLISTFRTIAEQISQLRLTR